VNASALAIIGPGLQVTSPGRRGRRDVQGECGLDRPAPGLEHAFLDHVAGAVAALLARLEHEDHPSGQRLPPGVEQPCGGREHGRVGVVPARVHRAVHLRGEREAAVLTQRQRVHVAAQQHRRPRVGPVEDGGHRRAGLALRDMQVEALQSVQHGGLRGGQVEPQFGVFVQLTTQRDRSGLKGSGGLEQTGEPRVVGQGGRGGSHELMMTPGGPA
jgi:hypothetical protein